MPNIQSLNLEAKLPRNNNLDASYDIDATLQDGKLSVGRVKHVREKKALNTIS